MLKNSTKSIYSIKTNKVIINKTNKSSNLYDAGIEHVHIVDTNDKFIINVYVLCLIILT